MKSTTRRLLAFPALLLAGAACGIVLAPWIRPHTDRSMVQLPGAPGESDEPEPIASVHTVRVSEGELAQVVDVYGTVVPRPDAIVATVLQSEVAVKRVLVVAGTEVIKGDPLCEVEPSAATHAQLQSARADAESAQKLLQAAVDRQSMNLATRQDLLQAEAAQKDAELKLRQIESTLPDQDGIVRAATAGRILDIHIQNGSLAASGAPLLETLADDAVLVLLGVQPDHAAHLAPGQTIQLESTGGEAGSSVTGLIQRVGPSINATSRLVDVLAAPQAGAPLRLGETMRGRLVMTSARGMLVPRSSVLPEDGQYVVWVVADGHAHRRTVTTGLQTQDSVQITAGPVAAGDEIVTLGNYELHDGIAVHVETGR